MQSCPNYQLLNMNIILPREHAVIAENASDYITVRGAGTAGAAEAAAPPALCSAGAAGAKNALCSTGANGAERRRFRKF